MRELVWLADTKKMIKEFPDKVKEEIGGQLRLIQAGLIPKDAKPFKGLGSGVIEIALKHNKEAYRCVQALQIDEEIYILHVFQKKSKSGITTPQSDIELIKKRYQDAFKVSNVKRLNKN